MEGWSYEGHRCIPAYLCTVYCMRVQVGSISGQEGGSSLRVKYTISHPINAKLKFLNEKSTTLCCGWEQNVLLVGVVYVEVTTIEGVCCNAL